MTNIFGKSQGDVNDNRSGMTFKNARTVFDGVELKYSICGGKVKVALEPLSNTPSCYGRVEVSLKTLPNGRVHVAFILPEILVIDNIWCNKVIHAQSGKISKKKVVKANEREFVNYRMTKIKAKTKKSRTGE